MRRNSRALVPHSSLSPTITWALFIFLVLCYNPLLISVSARKLFPQETREILQHYTDNDRCACTIAGGWKIEINEKETKSQQIFSAGVSMLCTGGSE